MGKIDPHSSPFIWYILLKGAARRGMVHNILVREGGGTDPRKVREGSPGAKQMKLYLYNFTKKGVYSIFFP